MEGMDPSLLQDFLTESAELIEQLDGDLVKLESAEDAATQQDLLNGCFRALHTIKGAAGFLGLTNVINFAHVAEDSLNRLRKGEVDVTPEVMDALLASADVVREQVDQLNGGLDAAEAPPELIEKLKSVVGQTAAGDAQNGDADKSVADSEKQDDDLPGKPLELPPQKADLLEFMVADMNDYAGQLEEVIGQIGNDATRTEAATHLHEIADNLAKTADFFELDDLTAAIRLLLEVAPKMGDLAHELVPELVVRVAATRQLILDQTHWLEKGRALVWSLGTLSQRMRDLAEGKPLDDEIMGAHEGDPAKVLLIDEVIDDHQPKQGDTDAAAASEDAPEDTAGKIEPTASTETDKSTVAAADAANAPAAAKTAKQQQPVAEQTIRVEVGRLEELLNLVGQLVLNKNRILGLTRNMRDVGMPQELKEDVGGAAGELDRLTGELQVGVMRTRMQPLAKLFDRYPRVIRDIARQTDKKIDLEIVGKDTEVDKSVLELLADPLVHVLRNSADHGVEKPETRRENGKKETGKIRLEAEHQGSHVRVAITDDGKGLDRKVLGTKAVERGIASADQVAQMSDSDVFNFIFEAGFSTAAKVSDLSGRGVGMDVVRTNINRLNGSISVSSKLGEGTTIEILIPLTVAIMPAMVVGVGQHLYSVPLQCILEIVRPENEQVHSINGQQVMRLRQEVLPLLNMQERLNETAVDRPGRFAVIVGVGGQKAGLLVDRLIGQQEIVIKPLDDVYTQGGPFSGATIREDGQVCLILDVVQLLRTSKTNRQELAKAA